MRSSAFVAKAFFRMAREVACPECIVDILARETLTSIRPFSLPRGLLTAWALRCSKLLLLQLHLLQLDPLLLDLLLLLLRLHTQLLIL